jgi:phage tail-like protein
MATGDRKDPYSGYNFRLEIENSAVAAFSECGGLTFDADSVDYREGTDKRLSVRKLMGLRKFANISLKRGYTDNKELWNWYKNILNGIADRRNGAIVLQDELHADVLRWNWSDGWITKYEGPTFNANNNDVVLEQIEIVVERVELQ